MRWLYAALWKAHSEAGGMSRDKRWSERIRADVYVMTLVKIYYKFHEYRRINY